MNQPLYKAIYQDLKKAILNETYAIGAQLPTEKDFIKQYDVSAITIKKAMDLLKDDQLISRQPGKGTFVISNTVNSVDAPFSESELPVIGLIFTDFSDIFGGNILRHIILHSEDKAQIVFKISHGDPEKEEKFLNELIELGAEGIILIPASSEFLSSKLLELVAKNYPLVLIDRTMEKLPSCSVQIDNYYASQVLVEHLFHHGHRKIGIVTANTHITTIEERIEGALTAHVENDIGFKQSQIFTELASMVPNSGVQPQEDVEKIKDFLQRNRDLTAVFAGEYSAALLVKQAIEELGKEVYTDYSLVCFDHPVDVFSVKNQFVFTHILQDQDAMGAMAMDLILKKIQNPALIEKIDAPFSLIEGNSVRTINEKPVNLYEY